MMNVFSIGHKEFMQLFYEGQYNEVKNKGRIFTHLCYLYVEVVGDKKQKAFNNLYIWHGNILGQVMSIS